MEKKYMLEVDLHSHSSFSCCGLHSFVEMLERGKALGMKGLAITDHGQALGGRLNKPFFTRLNNPVPGIRLLKGVECNVLEEPGRIDCPKEWLAYMDIVMLGVHPNLKAGLDKTTITRMLLRAMKDNQYVDVIVHIDSSVHDVDIEPVVEAALNYGMAMEINNSKTFYGATRPGATDELIAVCMNLKCPIVVSSDAHAINEVGRDDQVRALLEKAKFPEDLIVNRDAETAFSFVDNNRKLKRGVKP